MDLDTIFGPEKPEPTDSRNSWCGNPWKSFILMFGDKFDLRHLSRLYINDHKLTGAYGNGGMGLLLIVIVDHSLISC
jgi:hypothetical protein